MSTCMYYFTGTGNSYYAAKKLGEYLNEVDIVPMVGAMNKNEYDCNYDNVGIIFPLYYGGLPEIAIQFLRRINIKRTAYVFALSTAGGTKGRAMAQVENILREKNVKLSANFYVTMPDSYVKMFEMTNEEESKKIIHKADLEIKNIAQLISNKKKTKVSKGFYGRVVGPFYINFIKTVNNRDKNFYVEDSCISCGTCENVCPMNNIKLINGRPTWKHKCQNCMACIQCCPAIAIQMGEKTKKRGRYKNPYVTIEELASQKKM